MAILSRAGLVRNQSWQDEVRGFPLHYPPLCAYMTFLSHTFDSAVAYSINALVKEDCTSVAFTEVICTNSSLDHNLLTDMLDQKRISMAISVQ